MSRPHDSIEAALLLVAVLLFVLAGPLLGSDGVEGFEEQALELSGPQARTA